MGGIAQLKSVGHYVERKKERMKKKWMERGRSVNRCWERERIKGVCFCKLHLSQLLYHYVYTTNKYGVEN